MKTTLLALTLLTTLLQADEGMSWVDQKIEEIKPQRHGLSSSTLASLKSPFIIIKSESGKSGKSRKSGKSSTPSKVSSTSTGLIPVTKSRYSSTLTLQAILNTSALINNKWYKENSDVRGYKLTEVKNGYVVLKRKKKTVKLFIAQENKNINISTK